MTTKTKAVLTWWIIALTLTGFWVAVGLAIGVALSRWH